MYIYRMKDVEVPTTQLTRQAENDCEMKITVSGKRLQQKRLTTSAKKIPW
jgi:hypothetical protein